MTSVTFFRYSFTFLYVRESYCRTEGETGIVYKLYKHTIYSSTVQKKMNLVFHPEQFLKSIPQDIAETKESFHLYSRTTLFLQFLHGKGPFPPNRPMHLLY